MGITIDNTQSPAADETCRDREAGQRIQNSVIWFEILGQDDARLRAFFGELFDWSFQPINSEYSMIPEPSTGIAGGVGKTPKEGCRGWTTFYVQVPDIDASLARASSLGGSTVVPVTTLADGMRIAVFADPEGHPVGLVEQAA